jgi:hypothetical protein
MHDPHTFKHLTSRHKDLNLNIGNTLSKNDPDPGTSLIHGQTLSYSRHFTSRITILLHMSMKQCVEKDMRNSQEHVRLVT